MKSPYLNLKLSGVGIPKTVELSGIGRSGNRR
jgi:hypothetical protein